MTTTIPYIFPFVTKRSNHSFKPLLSCFNVTCSRYYSITDDDKVSAKSRKGVDEENTIKGDKQITEPDMLDRSKEAKKKLLELLSDIKVSPQVSNQNQRIYSNLKLAKPLPLQSRKELFFVKKKESTPQEKVDLAVKAVASTLKGDPEKIQLELNHQLNSMNVSKEGLETEGTEKVCETDPDILIGEVGEKIMTSVKDVASTVCVDSQPVQSELAKRLLHIATEVTPPKEQWKNMQNLCEGIKIDMKPVKEETTVTVKDQSNTARQPHEQSRNREHRKVNLFSSPPLNIFKLGEKIKDEKKNVLWLSLQEKELKTLVQFAPKNAFEEMIRWTEQGKHWKFPIDNEIDMGPEENVGFQEHVFLEHHLHGFPTKGPVRHFMELVVTGLSMNPHITVDRKIENIEWFRQYFKDKEDILKDHDALS